MASARENKRTGRNLPPDSPHTGLRAAGFRNYAEYMSTAEFHGAARELMRLAATCATAYMCAERFYWRCHCMLLSDFLTARGWQVLHILGPGQTRPYHLTPGAQVEAGDLVYHPPRLRCFPVNAPESAAIQECGVLE